MNVSAVAILLSSSYAQRVEPVPAPSDVILALRTENDEAQFHLGELIPVQFFYSAKTPGKYLWVPNSSRLEGGHSVEISCSPAAERIRPYPRPLDEITFSQMLNSCDGFGFGGGVGGGCSDCDGEVPLRAAAVSFGVFPLNTYVRFRVSGTYTCEASSAEVTTTSREEKIRPALLLKSNPIVVTVIDDPAWAHSAVTAYADGYDKLCHGHDVAERLFLQCSDIARRITYLDTSESLATEVDAFDGRNRGWETGFWDAIQHSSYPQEAFRLMSARMQAPDFQVSTIVLEWLASSELRMEVPDAFEGGAPALYRSQAVEKLRKYVRLLGSSLPKKNASVLAESANTYRTFAEQKYCERQSLIPGKEQNNVLSALGIGR